VTTTHLDNHYEIAEGRLLVTGKQPPAHHAAVVELMVALKQACPPGLLVAVGSLTFRPTPQTTLRPDLLVCHRDHQPTQVPLLVVEVLSPATRTTDIVLKRTLYERHGIPSYWLVDPTTQELTILELTDNTYTCQAVIHPVETFQTTHPFPITLTS
jgi:Uma2 family endonuclease